MPESKANKKQLMPFLISVAILLFCEVFFFRNVIFNDRLISNNRDGRLTMLITEHWHRVVCGRASVADLGMMYPASGTLGYSDILLGYGIIHTLFRFMGLDMFFAYKFTIIAVHMFGTFTAFYLLRRILKCRYIWALFGVIAFSYSNTYAAHLGHTQLATISLIPFLTILWIRFFQNLNNRKKRNIYAVLGIVFFVLLVYTSWYIACFTAIFVLAFGVIYAIKLHWNERLLLRELKVFISTIRFDMLIYILLGTVLLIPFVILELPVMKMSGGRSYDELIPYIPDIIDIINVPETNLIMRYFIIPLDLWKRDVTNEVIQGFSIILLLVFGCAKILLSKYKSKVINKKEKKTILLFETLWISVVVCLAFTVRISSVGHSLWYFLYEFIPCVSSLRAIARFFLYLSLPMSMAAAVIMDKTTSSFLSVCTKPEKNTYRTVSAVILVLLFVFNIDVKGVYSAYTQKSGADFISSITPPPEDCKVFYIVDDPEISDKYFDEVHMDAYQIADYFGIKTINGYSGIHPTNYDGVLLCMAKSYKEAVAEWIKNNDIHDAYVYDLNTNTWSKHDYNN